MSLWRSSPTYKIRRKILKLGTAHLHSAAHCSISPPVFLSSDRISAAYLLFRFPSQLKYLVWSSTTCQQVKDSDIIQLKNCRRSCNRMGRLEVSMLLLVLKPVKRPELKPSWHLMAGEAQEREVQTDSVTFPWAQSRTSTQVLYIHQV